MTQESVQESFNKIENLLNQKKIRYILCDTSSSPKVAEINLNILYDNLVKSEDVLDVISKQLQDLPSRFAFDIRIDRDTYRLTEMTKTGGKTLSIMNSGYIGEFAKNLTIFNMGFQASK